MGQGIWRYPPTDTGSPSWGSFPSSDWAHLGWKSHISVKLISTGLALARRQKSGLLTHTARTAKEGGVGDPSICLFHLRGQSQFPWPPSQLYQGYLSPLVFSGLLWDASSAMTVAEGSPGQVEAWFAFQALPTYWSPVWEMSAAARSFPR